MANENKPVNERPGEFQLIEKYFAPLAGEGAFGLRDDAALLSPPRRFPDQQIVVTQDAIAEGVHFFADDPPHSIARKALRVNLSDLIAKGAEPFAYSLALGLPDDFGEDLVAGLAKGLQQDQQQFNVNLTGGDTYRSPGGLVLSITAFGLVGRGGYKSRTGAKIGDDLLITGTIGDGAFGLLARRGRLKKVAPETIQKLVNSYNIPTILPASSQLVRKFAHAAMDISDGLLGDIEKLCKASNLSAEIELTNVPLSTEAAAVRNAHPELTFLPFTGGDDYQVLMSVPKTSTDACLEAASELGVPLTVIGRIIKKKIKSLCVLEDRREVVIEEGSFSHF